MELAKNRKASGQYGSFRSEFPYCSHLRREECYKLVGELITDFEDEVYSVDGKAVIENTRVVLDLPTLAQKIKKTGRNPIIASITEFPKLKEAGEKIPIESSRGGAEQLVQVLPRTPKN